MSEMGATSSLLGGLSDVPGWTGPLPASAVEKALADQVLLLTLNQWDQHAYFNFFVDSNPSGGLQWTVRGPSFGEAYEREVDGRRTLVGNATCFVSPTAVADAANGRSYSTGAIIAGLPVAMPYLNVLRPLRSLFGGHGWRSGDDRFDRLFHVQTLRKSDDSARGVLAPVLTMMAAREDWTFSLFAQHLICVTRQPFVSVLEAQGTLNQVLQISAALQPAAATPGILASSGGPRGAVPVPGGLPAMPDGSPFDPDTIERQLAALTPEQQAAWIVRMSGHPGATQEQIAEAIRRGQPGR